MDNLKIKSEYFFPGSIIDIEYSLPEDILSNDHLKKMFPEWNMDAASKKTGVIERRISKYGQTAKDLGLQACKKLLLKHPFLKQKLDAILFCTQTPDYIMPSNAFLIHRDLGLSEKVLAFDYNLACSGYVYGLLLASSLIKTGMVKNVLLVTGDTYSKIINPSDRATRILFGDAASATWIGTSNTAHFKPLINKIDNFDLGTDSAGWNKFVVQTGGYRNPIDQNKVNEDDGKIFMNGMQILNFVNFKIVPHLKEFLIKNDIKTADITQYLLHQGSLLAIESIKKKLHLNNNQIFSNITNIGNTVSSSLPILIKDYFSNIDVPKGSKLLICSFGVGYSWGSALVTK